MLQWFKKQDEGSPAGKNGSDMHITLARKLVEYLGTQISTPKKATSIVSQIARFKELPPSYQERELPALYLKVETYLVNEDPLQKYTRSQLRKNISYRFEPLMEYDHFSLIFAPEQEQEVLLSLFFLKNVLIHANPIIGSIDEDFLNNLSEWVYLVPNINGQPIPFDLNERTPESLPEWPRLLAKVSVQLFFYLEEIAGENQAASIFEKSYRDLAEVYRPLETFYSVVQMLPDKLLDESKIGLLNAEQVRSVFLNKVQNLQRANDELSLKNQELKNAKDELVIAQDTAMESVKLLHSVLDAVEEGIVTADAEGKIILVNEQIKQIYGYDEQEMIGQSIEFLMPEKYRAQHRQGMKRYKATRESRAIGQLLTLEGQRKDRSVFPCEVQVRETQIAGRIFFTAAIRDISDEVKQESTIERTTSHLRGADQRFKNLLDASPDPIFTLSLDGAFTRLNPAFESLTAWSKEEWMNKPFTQIVHPDDSIETLKLFQQVLQGEPASLPSIRVRTKDGSHITAELVITPDIQNGKMAGAMGILKNLTPYLEKEKNLKAQFNRVRMLLDNSPDAAVLVVNRKIAYVNKAGLTLLGARESRQLLEKQFENFIVAPRREEFRSVISDLKSRQELQTVTLRLDGLNRPAQLLLQPVPLKQGNGFIAYLREERVEGAAPGAATIEFDHLRELLEPMNDAVMFIDQNGSIRLANLPARQMLNSGSEFEAETSLHAFLDVQHHPALDQWLNESSGNTLHWESAAIHSGDGVSSPYELRGQRTQFPFPAGALITIRRIEEQVDLEEVQILRAELQAARAKFRDAQTMMQQLQSRTEKLEADSREAAAMLEDAQIMVKKLTQELRSAQKQLDEYEKSQTTSVEELQDLREKMELLGKMIPVCAKTLQIRDDRRYWEELREFIRNPQNHALLRGISPEAQGSGDSSD